MKLPVGEPSPAAERLGHRAAWAVFALFAAAELVFACWPGRAGELGRQADLSGWDVLLVAVAPVLALVVHLALPKSARSSFWRTGWLCIGLTVLLWGVTCGVVGAVR